MSGAQAQEAAPATGHDTIKTLAAFAGSVGSMREKFAEASASSHALLAPVYAARESGADDAALAKMMTDAITPDAVGAAVGVKGADALELASGIGRVVARTLKWASHTKSTVDAKVLRLGGKFFPFVLRIVELELAFVFFALRFVLEIIVSAISHPIGLALKGAVVAVLASLGIGAPAAVAASPVLLLSSRAYKRDIAPADAAAVHAAFDSLMIARWRYIWDHPLVQGHIGPIAQDWHAAFPGLTQSPSDAISVQDAIGVLMASLQDETVRRVQLEKRVCALENSK